MLKSEIALVGVFFRPPIMCFATHFVYFWGEVEQSQFSLRGSRVLYLGEGNANLVVAVRNKRVVLRWVQRLATCKQCVGAGSGSGSGGIWNYLQDPDPQFEFRIRIQIRKGSGIRFLLSNWIFYPITIFIYGENSTNCQRLYILSHQKFVEQYSSQILNTFEWCLNFFLFCVL